MTRRFVLTGLILLLLLVPLCQSYFLPLLKDLLTQGIVTVLIIVWAISCARQGQDWHFPRLLYPALAIGFLSLLSLGHAPDWHQGLLVTYQFFARFLLYVLVIQVCRSWDDCRLLATVVVIGGVVVSAVVLLQHLFPHTGLLWGAMGRGLGTMGNPNAAGGYLAVTLPVAVAYVAAFKWPPRWGNLLAGCAIVAGLLATGSRGAGLGGLVGMAFVLAFLVLRGRSFREFVRRYGATLAIVCVSTLILLDLGFRFWGRSFLGYLIVRTDPSYGSNAERLDFTRNTLWMIQDYPLLGVGMGNFPSAYAHYASQIERKTDPPWQTLRPEHPHNELLNLMAENGVFGLAAIGWLLCVMLPPAFQALESSDRSQALLVAGILGSLTAATVHGMFYYVFHEPSASVTLFALVGILERVGRMA